VVTASVQAVVVCVVVDVVVSVSIGVIVAAVVAMASIASIFGRAAPEILIARAIWYCGVDHDISRILLLLDHCFLAPFFRDAFSRDL
jgi:hypothetical protein